jgi:hypothetical protein
MKEMMMMISFNGGLQTSWIHCLAKSTKKLFSGSETSIAAEGPNQVSRSFVNSRVLWVPASALLLNPKLGCSLARLLLSATTIGRSFGQKRARDHVAKTDVVMGHMEAKLL